jgi:hypothetical protein
MLKNLIHYVEVILSDCEALKKESSVPLGNSPSLAELHETICWIKQIMMQTDHTYREIHGIALIMGCFESILNKNETKPSHNLTEQGLITRLKEYYHTQLRPNVLYQDHFKTSYDLFKNHRWAWQALDCLDNGQICLPAANLFQLRVHYIIQGWHYRYPAPVNYLPDSKYNLITQMQLCMGNFIKNLQNLVLANPELKYVGFGQPLLNQVYGLYLPLIELIDCHRNRPWLLENTENAYQGYGFKTNVSAIRVIREKSSDEILPSQTITPVLKPKPISPVLFLKKIGDLDGKPFLNKTSPTTKEVTESTELTKSPLTKERLSY